MTRSVSKNMTKEPIWLFGYGSLIFKVDFPYLESRRATIRDWVRRFWQGSHDHRGTPGAPGRVVTLVPEHGAICTGIAYRIMPDVLEQLDIREKNGYLRLETRLDFEDGDFAQGLVYIALEDNPAFLGPAPEEDIARHIHRSHGPSGSNIEYLLDLADSLRKMSVDDPHVFEVEKHVNRLSSAAI